MNVDRCAKPGCDRLRDYGTHLTLNHPDYHPFVEPAPQPPADAATHEFKPNPDGTDHCARFERIDPWAPPCLRPSRDHAAAPPVSGDDAVVQEIADQLLSQPEREKRLDAFCESASKGEYTAGHVDYILTDLAIEAIRAGLERGRALGAREADLTFEEFTEVNRRRCESYNGFGESLQPSSKYTVAHWALSIASEAGEIADAILGWEGLKRSRAGKTKEDIGRELADVVTYCDLLASKLGFSLGKLIADKFEEVNKRCEFDRFSIARRSGGQGK